jgi:hypothetical protein
MRRLITVLGVGVLALTLFSFASPASAVDDIVIPIDTIVRGDEGDVEVVATVAVDPELVGDTCSAELTDSNNESTHPNNDLIVTSGSWNETIPDVESEANSTQVVAGEIILGETVVVEVRLGPDGVFSGGLTLTFDCEDVIPATTVAPTTEPPAQLPQSEVVAATAAQPTFTG